MRTLSVRLVVALLLTALCSSSDAGAQSPRFELGVRGVLTAADGEPANDLPGFGVFGRYRLNDRWAVGVSVDMIEYDFEQPALVLGLQPDRGVDPIDAVAESTVIGAWVERTYGRAGRPTTWFWGVGLGIASIDVPVAAGPLEGGGVFDIETDPGTEVIASALGGLRWHPGRFFFLEIGVRAEQHFADWQITDRVSVREGTIDDYLGLGGHLGLGIRF